MNIRMIALDMDGTLLDSDKRMSEANRLALERAAAAGIEIVPTTGRFYLGLPDFVRALPFIHYAITINGAAVCDIRNDLTLCNAAIAPQKAVEIMNYLETQPVIYDSYIGGWGYMTERLQQQAEEFAPNIHYLKMIRELRDPVPDLREYVLQRGDPVQKLQLFAKDTDTIERIASELRAQFTGICVASSVHRNLEINDAHANKGEAIGKLAEHLGFTAAEVMACGDGSNDLSMIHAAGIGVAMANARPEVLASADYVTASCDEDGVSKAIDHFMALI